MLSRFRTAGLVVLVIVTLASLLLSLAIGARSIAPDDVLRYLFKPEFGDPISQVVWQSRVPRTVLVVLSGASLGVAGGLMQAVTRNPLTDPGILGVNAGASLAVVAGLAFLGLTDLRNYMWFALAGAFITSIVVFIVGNTGKNRGNAVRMTLSGVAIGAVLSGFSSAILLTNSDVLRQMRGWAAGTTASQSLEDALSVVPLIAIGLVIAFLSTRALDVLALGEASAVAMGARPNRIRLVALVAITLLAGGATAATGPIGFVGLLAPHLARMMVGPHQGWITAYSMFLGTLVVAVSDVLGRILSPGEVPVGVVTAFIGAPVLIWMARRFRLNEL